MSVAPPTTRSHGDRTWSEAAATTLAQLADDVRGRAKGIDEDAGADDVHDLRTATRRLRTAVSIFGEAAGKRRRKAVDRELRRLAARLGEVRDLDILIRALGETDDVEPLRRAWRRERAGCAERLKREVDRPRLDHALDDARRLARSDDNGASRPESTAIVPRIASRAPALIWEAYGTVLAHELDPLTADPPVIHDLRKDAKRLRYTLEAFEDALDPGRTLIEQLIALQDAAGELHDAVVGRDRARSLAPSLDLAKHEAAAIEAFALDQEDRAESLRPGVAGCLHAVRSRAFRESLARALAGMGHVDPEP